MASSQVELYSMALSLLGDAPVSSVTETEGSRAINRLYAITLDAKIQSHNWNAFQMRANLALVNATPLYDFSYMFQLPQDPFCLQVLETNLTTSDPWRIETYETTTPSASYRVLLANVNSVSILYLARVTDVTRWGALFADAMAAELAYRVCYALTRNATLEDVLGKKAEALWQKGRSRDGQEGKPRNNLQSTVLTNVR